MTSIEFARQIRETSLRMVSAANASHIGGALSMADIVAVLYNDILRYRADEPEWPERDRFLLSKGHACVAIYAALALKGFFPKERLKTFAEPGSQLLSHISHHIPGVEISSGSLGHGLSYAVGMALAAKRQGRSHRIYVVLGDGEMDEGSNWEALMFAAHHKLDNLCAVIDYNKIQALGNTNDVMALEPLRAKIEAFNCSTVELDGHDHDALRQAFNEWPVEADRPTVIIAHTVKGKGVDFMENELAWHYRAPLGEMLNTALETLK